MQGNNCKHVGARRSTVLSLTFGEDSLARALRFQDMSETKSKYFHHYYPNQTNLQASNIKFFTTETSNIFPQLVTYKWAQ